MNVGASREAAFTEIRFKFTETIKQRLFIDRLRTFNIQRRKTGRIRQITAARQRKQRNRPCGMSAATEFFADLARFTAERGIDQIEQAGFSNTGISRKRRDLARQHVFESGGGLSFGIGDRKHGKSRHTVDRFQRRRIL